MSERLTGEGVENLETKTEGQLSEVDQLIAEAQVAATEAQRTAVMEKVETTQSKKKISKEVAERAEQLQQWFVALKADDAFVEDYAYEQIFDAAETETGVAAPEKIREALGALRKTGEALRQLGVVEPKSDALLRKMDELQKLHDKLFDQVQAAAVDALEVIKKKYKGEETEFEKQYQRLTGSPLVRGVEYDSHSLEAREQALKQEITQFLMWPVLENRLQPLEKQIASTKEQLAKLQREDPEEIKTMGDHQLFEKAKSLGVLPSDLGKLNAYDLLDRITYRIKNLNEQIKGLEIQLPRERLAFEVNRTVIDDFIKDEHDETALREAMVWFRSYLGVLRDTGSSSHKDWLKDTPPPKDGFAQKVLGQYVQFAVPIPRNDTRELGNVGSAMGDFTPVGQLMGGSQTVGTTQYYNNESYLSSYSQFDFLISRLGGKSEDQARVLLARNYSISPEKIKQQYEALSAVTLDKRSPEVKALLERFPTVDALISQVFAGQGKFFNLQRAYQKIDTGLRGEKKTKVEALPEALANIGWKESKLGALVEHGQDVRTVDREYARLLERLSQPQIDAERAFDVRGPDGEFHVYTTDQAVNLLRRARRDARDIVSDSGRLAGELREQVGSLEVKVEGLGNQLETERRAAMARETELSERLTREQDEAVRQAQREGSDQLVAETRKSQEIVQGVLTQLRGALKKKPGLLGGDKDLRETVETLVRQLGGK